METNGHKSLSFWECHRGYGNQLYKYRPDTQVTTRFLFNLNGYQQIYNPGHRSCVTAKEGDSYLYFHKCDDDNIYQKWQWDIVNEGIGV